MVPLRCCRRCGERLSAVPAPRCAACGETHCPLAFPAHGPAMTAAGFALARSGERPAVWDLGG